MEESLVNAATADLLVKIAWHSGIAIVSAAVAVIGTLLWGRGGYKRVKQRLDALESQERAPAITQTFNFSTGRDRRRELQSAIDASTVHRLQETIRTLTQHPLEGGHTYANLPNGTNIVTMADGTIRLALPIEVSAAFHGGLDGRLAGTIEHEKKAPPKDDAE